MALRTTPQSPKPPEEEEIIRRPPPSAATSDDSFLFSMWEVFKRVCARLSHALVASVSVPAKLLWWPASAYYSWSSTPPPAALTISELGPSVGANFVNGKPSLQQNGDRSIANVVVISDYSARHKEVLESLSQEIEIHLQETSENFHINRPNILLIGAPGSGKSTIIDAVFSMTTANTTAEAGITKHSRPGVPVNIFEFTYGSTFAFAEVDLEQQLLVFLEERSVVPTDAEHRASVQELSSSESVKSSLSLENGERIHAVWFVISAAAPRIGEAEMKLIRDVLVGRFGLPTFLVLSKKDLAMRENLVADGGEAALEQLVWKFRELFEGVVKAVVPVTALFPTPQRMYITCPQCGSDDLVHYRRKRTTACRTCRQWTASTVISHGLDQLVTATAQLLPGTVRYVWWHAQQIDLAAKDAIAREAMSELWKSLGDGGPNSSGGSNAVASFPALLVRRNFMSLAAVLIGKLGALFGMYEGQLANGRELWHEIATARVLHLLATFVQQMEKAEDDPSRTLEEKEREARAFLVIFGVLLYQELKQVACARFFTGSESSRPTAAPSDMGLEGTDEACVGKNGGTTAIFF